jgi:hypothetical protein
MIMLIVMTIKRDMKRFLMEKSLCLEANNSTLGFYPHGKSKYKK